MTAPQSFCYFLGIEPEKLSREEFLLLEAELFVRVIEEVKAYFREYYQIYFLLLNFNKEMEDTMLEENFLRLIIQDILSTEEYTIDGIAYYTLNHPDVIYEALSGKIQNPSAIFLKRTIELHRSVRKELYKKIIQKIAKIYLSIS